MIDYSIIKEIINQADAIVIGAGAGLSASAGINYGEDNFKDNFPELVEKYGMTDMYTSSFYTFDTEEERWSYWAKHINYLYNTDVKKVYKDLYKLMKNKNYFVITTNVDGQFLKAGFNKEKVFEVQGSLSKIQCSVKCHDKLYDDLDIVDEMLKKDFNCKVPSSLVPYCPVCGEKMNVNLRKDMFFVEDENWHFLNEEYKKYIKVNKGKKLVLLEFGVGFNTPSIIRFPFESMALNYKDTYLVRINNKYCKPSLGESNKFILVNDNCENFINNVI